jgi:hypothetical protein
MKAAEILLREHISPEPTIRLTAQATMSTCRLRVQPSTSTTIGQLVGFGRLPLSMIEMADFEPGGLRRLFVDFAPALMRHAWRAIYLVAEEAHGLANCWPSSAN